MTRPSDAPRTYTVQADAEGVCLSPLRDRLPPVPPSAHPLIPPFQSPPPTPLTSGPTAGKGTGRRGCRETETGPRVTLGRQLLLPQTLPEAGVSGPHVDGVHGFHPSYRDPRPRPVPPLSRTGTTRQGTARCPCRRGRTCVTTCHCCAGATWWSARCCSGWSTRSRAPFHPPPQDPRIRGATGGEGRRRRVLAAGVVVAPLREGPEARPEVPAVHAPRVGDRVDPVTARPETPLV